MSLPLALRLHHCLNALHVSARLRRRFSKRKAIKIARVYGRIIHPFLYASTGARK